jgi:hypothetical protein
MRIPPIHPFLFALYPILFVWSSNFGSVSPEEIVAPLVIAVGATLVVLLIPYLCFGWDIRRIGICTSFFICASFSYWALQELTSYALLGKPVGMSNYHLLPVWVLMLFLGTAYIARTRGNLVKVTSVLNVVSCLLIVFSGVNIVRYSVGTAHLEFKPVELKLDKVTPGQKEVTRAALGAERSLPDIYYIILDAYGRSDVLKNMYDYDNSAFLDRLSQKGFYVASRSTSNYCTTSLSLASSLNFTLLDNLPPEIESERAGRKLLHEMIRNNRISSVLKECGYKTISFSSGYSMTEITSADFYVFPPYNISEFLNNLISMTPLQFVYLQLFHGRGVGNHFHRERLSFTFDNLAKARKGIGPFFVFCHMVTPHPPFLFDEEGRPVSPMRSFTFDDASDFHHMNPSLQKEYCSGYIRQIPFINRKIMTVVEKIISRSKVPPIIVIQGDHGPGATWDWNNADPVNSALIERFSILNAIYVPEKIRRFLYPGMTPVNTFRIILKYGFGKPLELLPDKSYGCNKPDLFKLTDVTDRIR